MAKIDHDLAELLLAEARRINRPEFAADDPVGFARRYDALPDREIAGLLCATIAWGNRKMICRDCERLLGLMDHRPYDYVMDRGYEELPDDLNIHRTFFSRNLKHYLRGLRLVYARHGSLQGLARHARIDLAEMPAWALAAAIGSHLSEAGDGRADSRCLPVNLDTTALKRLNMWLRWMVRRDGIVDPGGWDVITPAQLYIPLDVHVGDTARQLGLLTRRTPDRKAVVELTETLRLICPDDPTLLDFALFGIGMGL